MATTPKPVVDMFAGSRRDLIDQIRDETLDEIDSFLKKIQIPFNYLPDFLKNPNWYPGNKITGLKNIIERFLEKTISKYYFKIQQENLPVKFVIDTVRKNLFQGGWTVNRDLNITMATRGGDDARKAISPSRIDEPPRSLPLKNKPYKTKVYREDAELRGLCDYCGVYIRIRHTSNFVHVNVCQNPARHYFCSKECKINWIFGLNEKTSQEEA